MKISKFFLGLAMTFSLANFSYGQQQVNITQINGQPSSQYTNSSNPYLFNINSDMTAVSNQSHFDFTIQIAVSTAPGCPVDVWFIYNNSSNPFYVDSFDPGTYTIDLTNYFLVFPQAPFFTPKSIQVKTGDVPLGCPANEFISPNYYFKVDYQVPPVIDFRMVSSSPLSGSGSWYNLAFNWTQSSDPKPGHIWITDYKAYRNDYYVNSFGIASSGQVGFPSYSTNYKKNIFTLKVEDNYSNLSASSNKAYAYDSSVKGISGSMDSAIEIQGADLDCQDGKDVIFNGWFKILQGMHLNTEKLFLNRETNGNVTRLSFPQATSTLEFDYLYLQAGTEIASNGGNLNIYSQNIVTLDQTNSNISTNFSTNNNTLNLDADINFENGSFLLVNDNLNISQNRTIRIKTGSKLVVGENANFTYGTGSSIILEDGAVLEIDGIVNVSTFQSPNLIMENGSSFRLKDGAKLVSDWGVTTDKNFECGTNAEIVVNISFTATNSVFTKSNSATNWRGFFVTNPTAILNLTNCSIQNAQIGVYGALDFISINLNNCTINDNIFGIVARNNGSGSVEIKNCSIFDNNYGVYTDLSGYAEIDGSEIYNNQKGIYTTVRGFVTAKNTEIYDNTNYGATISNEANAFFGSEFTGGQNRFFNNGTWDILNYESSYPKTIFAQNNFWFPDNGQAGNCNTNGNNCFDENLLPINSCAAVKTYPNADCIPNGNAVNSQEINDLLSAFESEIDGDFASAETKFMNFITTFPSSNYWSTALSGVVRNKKA